MRLKSGSPSTLTFNFYTDDEPADPGIVTVTIKDAQGATVTTGTASGTGTNPRTFMAPGSLTEGEYVATASGSNGYTETLRFEVTGRHLFTVAEARNSDRELADTVKFSTAELRHYREVVEAEFERITSRSFVPRTVVVTIETTGADAEWVGLFDVRSLVALYGPNGALTVSDYRLDANGVLEGLGSLASGTTLRVVVAYGFLSPPQEVKRVGMLRLRSMLNAENSGIPDRATAFVAAEGGNFTLATAGRNGYETGVPEVDAVLARYNRRVTASMVGIL